MKKILLTAALCAVFAAPAFSSDFGPKRSGGGAMLAGDMSAHCKMVMKHPGRYKHHTVRACTMTPNGTK